MRDVTTSALLCIGINSISTHTPHAGRDCFCEILGPASRISTHTPHAGRDNVLIFRRAGQKISTHTPHAGRD